MIKATHNYFGAGAIGAFLLIAAVPGGIGQSQESTQGVVVAGAEASRTGGAPASVTPRIDWP